MPRAHCGELCVMGKGAGAGVLGPVHDGLDYVPLPQIHGLRPHPPAPWNVTVIRERARAN